MARFELTDEEYELLKPHLPAERPNKKGRPWMPHRQVLNGIFWVLRTGAPWRDMPERYGKWQTVYDRFSRWRREGLIQRLLQILVDSARCRDLLDFDFGAMDGTVVRAHKAASGARKKNRREDTHA